MDVRALFETVDRELQFLRMYERHRQELTIFLSEVCGDDQERRQELQEIRGQEKAMLQQALAHVRQAEQIIGSMPDGVSRSMLYARYLLGESWETIAHELGYGYGHCRGRLRMKALKEAQGVLDAIQ